MKISKFSLNGLLLVVNCLRKPTHTNFDPSFFFTFISDGENLLELRKMKSLFCQQSPGKNGKYSPPTKNAYEKQSKIWNISIRKVVYWQFSYFAFSFSQTNKALSWNPIVCIRIETKIDRQKKKSAFFVQKSNSEKKWEEWTRSNELHLERTFV